MVSQSLGVGHDEQLEKNPALSAVAQTGFTGGASVVSGLWESNAVERSAREESATTSAPVSPGRPSDPTSDPTSDRTSEPTSPPGGASATSREESGAVAASLSRAASLLDVVESSPHPTNA